MLPDIEVFVIFPPVIATLVGSNSSAIATVTLPPTLVAVTPAPVKSMLVTFAVRTMPSSLIVMIAGLPSIPWIPCGPISP